jgi:hypothetical protein
MCAACDEIDKEDAELVEALIGVLRALTAKDDPNRLAARKYGEGIESLFGSDDSASAPLAKAGPSGQPQVSGEHPPPWQFWILWNPNGKTNPRVTFKTQKEAMDAAAKMVERNPDQRFYWCRVEGYASLAPPAPVSAVFHDLHPF